MPFNLYQGREIVLRKLNADGSPLTNPTADDVIWIDYPQQFSFGTVKGDRVEIKNEGPEGTICKVTKPGKLQSSKLDLQIAKIVPKLLWFLDGGTYDAATDKHTAPFTNGDAPAPFKAEVYAEKYADGAHLHGDLAGFLKIVLPNCIGTHGDITAAGDNFSNPNVSIVSEEYVDTDAPANSIPCYDFDNANALPSASDYPISFNVSGGGSALAGVVISVPGETDVTTDAEGSGTFNLTPGVHTYSMVKSGYVTKTGTFTVGLINADVDVEMQVG